MGSPAATGAGAVVAGASCARAELKPTANPAAVVAAARSAEVVKFFRDQMRLVCTAHLRCVAPPAL